MTSAYKTHRKTCGSCGVPYILVGKLHDLREVQPELDLWLAFGMGRNFRFISVNSICAVLGEPRSTSLPVFHALTDCDTTSCFFGKGKKSAWQAWEIFPEVTPTFEMLAKTPFMQLTTDSPLFKQIPFAACPSHRSPGRDLDSQRSATATCAITRAVLVV